MNNGQSWTIRILIITWFILGPRSSPFDMHWAVAFRGIAAVAAAADLKTVKSSSAVGCKISIPWSFHHVSPNFSWDMLRWLQNLIVLVLGGSEVGTHFSGNFASQDSMAQRHSTEKDLLAMDITFFHSWKPWTNHTNLHPNVSRLRYSWCPPLSDWQPAAIAMYRRPRNWGSGRSGRVAQSRFG